MNILSVYYNTGFIVKAYEFEDHYFVSFSFLEIEHSYSCPDEPFAIKLAKSIADFHTKDMQRLKRLFKCDEDFNFPFF